MITTSYQRRRKQYLFNDNDLISKKKKKEKKKSIITIKFLSLLKYIHSSYSFICFSKNIIFNLSIYQLAIRLNFIQSL